MNVGTLDDLIRDLRKFDGRKEVVQQLRKEIREPIPTVRKAIKRRALDTLPKRGRLNVWVSQTKVTAKVTLSGRRAGVRLKGSRKSQNDKSDLRRLDQSGRVRAPSWGHRTKASWHTQQVPSGFFSAPATEIDQWRGACLKALDNALNTIRRG